jgi:hypothetical protein
MANNGSKIGDNELMSSIGNMNRKTLFYQIVVDGLLFQERKAFLNQTKISTNNLLNVSRNFKGLKKDHFYWKLNKVYSLIYYNSSLYRKHIRLLLSTKSQLSIKFFNAQKRFAYKM